MTLNKRRKILISACLLGDKVRWNGAQKLNSSLISWCEENDIELVPVCPENELFGTPRPPIRLRLKEGEICAMMNGTDVSLELENKCKEIYDRNQDALGFIGIHGSPSCGISVGVKGLGKVTKGFMHKVPDIPTVESGQVRSPHQRSVFLNRVNKSLSEGE